MTSHLYMLDASALIACFLDERGAEVVHEALSGESLITAVNVSETASRLLKGGMPFEEIPSILSSFPMKIINVNADIAYKAAFIGSFTKSFGLSLADRICLAAAIIHNAKVLTADRAWAKLKLPDLRIQVIR